jgi:hypothetical protein
MDLHTTQNLKNLSNYLVTLQEILSEMETITHTLLTAQSETPPSEFDIFVESDGNNARQTLDDPDYQIELVECQHPSCFGYCA